MRLTIDRFLSWLKSSTVILLQFWNTAVSTAATTFANVYYWLVEVSEYLIAITCWITYLPTNWVTYLPTWQWLPSCWPTCPPTCCPIFINFSTKIITLPEKNPWSYYRRLANWTHSCSHRKPSDWRWTSYCGWSQVASYCYSFGTLPSLWLIERCVICSLRLGRGLWMLAFRLLWFGSRLGLLSGKKTLDSVTVNW